MEESIKYTADGKLVTSLQFAPGRFVVLVDREDSVPGFRFVVATYRLGADCWHRSEYRGTIAEAREAFREKALEVFAETISDALFGIK